MVSSTWEAAWDAAQPRLAVLRESLHRRNERDAPVTRVGQLDAEILDQELISVLQEPLNKALVLIHPSFKGKFEPELTLVIHAAIYKLSIWNTGASYGAKLQDLRYTVPSKKLSGALTPSGLPRRLLLIHGALSILVPYLHSRLRAYSLSHAWPDAPTSDPRRKAWEFLVSCESSYTLLSLASFVAFLYNGRFRTIADRVLNMQLIPSRSQVRRDVSYEFMNRQMVWHAFTEFLLFLLPLINARKLRRRVNRITASIAAIPSFVHSSLNKESGTQAADPPQTIGKYHALPADQCAICAENASFNLNMADSSNVFTAPHDVGVGEGSEVEPPAYPINTPYITSCGHIYCYCCIAECMIRTADDGEDEGWECLRCASVVKEADRFTVEIEEDESDMGGSMSEYAFSSDFDVDTTDLSGSMGSYSQLSGADTS